jgi:release factor glutamine methyltransferase
MTLSEAIRRGNGVLAAAGVEDAWREARHLARLALCLDASCLTDPTATMDAVHFERLLRRRAAREPMAYLRGRQGFWTLDLAVSPATLIPRADSETLIEAAVAALPDRANVRRVLDLGTGSGALLLAALSEFPAAWGVGVDLSPPAAALAARNAATNGMAGRAAFLCASWAAALAARFDLVLANPPYIRAADIAGLMPEVAAYEPAMALDGGADGLDAYREVIPALPGLLAPGGVAVVELGVGQAEAASDLARAAGFAEPRRRRDIGGVERALVLRARL